MQIIIRSLGAVVLASAAAAGPRLPEQAMTLAPFGQKGSEQMQLVGSEAGLEVWAQGFRARALAKGISAPTFDRAFRGVRYNADVITKDRNQSEFTKTIWDYLDSAASDSRVDTGKKVLRQNRKLLDRIEKTYGVDKEIVVAIWGLESSYGAFRGDFPLIASLATLAYDGRRGPFFEQQLIAALKIVQNGDVSPDKMTGSWAGAMGHTQFIPSSYLAFAVDFTGDGKRDIWSDNPADALASTAAYLAKSGWQSGRPWGVEIKLPPDYDFSISGDRVRKSVADWRALGIRTVDGGQVPDYGTASVLLPAGARGAAFLIFGNFQVIERYNSADAYVIGVGHLADRLKGGPTIKAGWPRDDRALLVNERIEMQDLLTRSGFNPGSIDGKIGPNTIAAVKAFQRSVGLVPDGYPSLDILRRLR